MRIIYMCVCVYLKSVGLERWIPLISIPAAQWASWAPRPRRWTAQVIYADLGAQSSNFFQDVSGFQGLLRFRGLFPISSPKFHDPEGKSKTPHIQRSVGSHCHQPWWVETAGGPKVMWRCLYVQLFLIWYDMTHTHTYIYYITTHLFS